MGGIVGAEMEASDEKNTVPVRMTVLVLLMAGCSKDRVVSLEVEKQSNVETKQFVISETGGTTWVARAHLACGGALGNPCRSGQHCVPGGLAGLVRSNRQ